MLDGEVRIDAWDALGLRAIPFEHSVADLLIEPRGDRILVHHLPEVRTSMPAGACSFRFRARDFPRSGTC
ncbi:MAG: hypothetical protein GY711_33490 [bacterium]|nr:hypothetical protein [bacterium]